MFADYNVLGRPGLKNLDTLKIRISKSEFQNNDQNSKQNPSAKLKAQNAPKESLRLPTGQAKLQLKAKSEIFLF